MKLNKLWSHLRQTAKSYSFRFRKHKHSFYWWQWKYLQDFQFCSKNKQLFVWKFPAAKQRLVKNEWLRFESFEYFKEHKSLWTYHFRSHLVELRRKPVRRKRFFASEYFSTTFKEPAISFSYPFIQNPFSHTRSIYFPFCNIFFVFHHLWKKGLNAISQIKFGWGRIFMVVACLQRIMDLKMLRL